MIPQRLKRLARLLIVAAEEVAKPEQIPGLLRLRRKVHAFCKRLNGGSKIAFAVIGKADVQLDARLVRSQSLGAPQFPQGIIPALLPHVGDPQVDVRRGRPGIERNDRAEILFRLRQMALLHGLHPLAEYLRRIKLGVRRNGQDEG